jgi:chromosome segregation ATPase
MKISAIRSEFKSPLSKLVAIFREGRDNWKTKHQQLKRECKRLQNQNSAAEKSRKGWRTQCLSLRQQISELQSELDGKKNNRDS